MASKTETGHAKNLANFDNLISFASGYGAAFNPSKSTLKLPALNALSNAAKEAISAVNAALPAYGNAVAAREVAFAPLNKLTTRIKNALKATASTEQVNDHAKTLILKIQGKRITPKKTEQEKAAAKAEGKEIKENSPFQLSFDNRLDNFDKLIKLLSGTGLYAPNEAELKTTALTAFYNDLKSQNASVIAATTHLSNARIIRNDCLYKKNTGLVDIAIDTKTYIKSIYGATSPQYKQISKLGFKTIKS